LVGLNVFNEVNCDVSGSDVFGSACLLINDLDLTDEFSDFSRAPLVKSRRLKIKK
jgi:hypothetical protein